MQRGYKEDKPKECRYCYFWSDRKEGCVLGDAGCYYVLSSAEKKKASDECENCPYGRDRPCIGWCTKKILAHRHEKRDMKHNEEGGSEKVG